MRAASTQTGSSGLSVTFDYWMAIDCDRPHAAVRDPGNDGLRAHVVPQVARGKGVVAVEDTHPRGTVKRDLSVLGPEHRTRRPSRVDVTFVM